MTSGCIHQPRVLERHPSRMADSRTDDVVQRLGRVGPAASRSRRSPVAEIEDVVGLRLEPPVPAPKSQPSAMPARPLNSDTDWRRCWLIAD